MLQYVVLCFVKTLFYIDLSFFNFKKVHAICLESDLLSAHIQAYKTQLNEPSFFTTKRVYLSTSEACP